MGMNRIKIIGILLLVLLAGTAQAQKERKFIRGGNELYHKQDFEKAEVEYRKALDKKAESYQAAFNLGDALYKQKKYEEALQQFSALAKDEANKERLGELYYNIGNTLLALQKTDESIEAYKESLRNVPDSEKAKYNLEFARHKKQQDQQNQDQNKDNKDQNQQNQNKDQQNQEQQKKDQQDQNQQKEDKSQDQNKERQDQQNQNQDKERQQPQQQRSSARSTGYQNQEDLF